MIITFRSAAAGDVIMFGRVAQALLSVMGKDPADAQGIITVAQLPAAIAALEHAAAADKAAARAAGDQDDDAADRPRGVEGPVALWQRAVPLIALLRYALAEEQPVLWS